MNFIIFVLPVIIWYLCELHFTKPVGRWLRTSFGVIGHVRSENYAEVVIAAALGLIFGLTFGPVYVFAFSPRIWPWIASFTLIGVSHMVGN